jgi:hypothetical protein
MGRGEKGDTAEDFISMVGFYGASWPACPTLYYILYYHSIFLRQGVPNLGAKVAAGLK